MNEKNEVAVIGNYLPSKMKLEKLQEIDKVAKDFYEICKQDDQSITTAIMRASAMATLREMLTPEIMQPIMSLQGSQIGFKGDKDWKREKDSAGNKIKGDGYPVEIVKDVFIFACSHGAKMIGNEVNILAGNGYLTRDYFGRALDESIGKSNWKITHDIPKVISSGDKIGAIVKSKIWWKDSSTGIDGCTHEMELAIKGDAYASSDSYLGKSDRKTRKWLLEKVTGKMFADGEAEESINITATEVKEKPKSKLNLEPKKELSDFDKYFEDKDVSANVMREFMAHNGCTVDDVSYMCEEAVKDAFKWKAEQLEKEGK